MRITYRSEHNHSYWKKRWHDIKVDDSMTNADSYPLKYSEKVVLANARRVLEAGCGPGRILRYYHERKINIVGIDFVELVVRKLKRVDKTLCVEVGDICKLRFEDASFDCVLAFGLYHNLPLDKIKIALAETARVLESDGNLCASFRSDNFQNLFIDWFKSRKNEVKKMKDKKVFHKINLTKNELKKLITSSGFLIESIYQVENMPFCYRFSIFRAKTHKKFDESLGRVEGYQLSILGNVIQRGLMLVFPGQFCNLYVVTAKKLPKY